MNISIGWINEDGELEKHMANLITEFQKANGSNNSSSNSIYNDPQPGTSRSFEQVVSLKKKFYLLLNFLFF